MAAVFNVVIYTSAHQDHAEAGVAKLDPHRDFVVRVMDRRHTQMNYENNVRMKDLSKVRRNLKRVVWLDDCAEAYPHHQQEHGIVVKRFEVKTLAEDSDSLDESFRDDKLLPELTPFLLALSKLGDFRPAIAAFKAGKCEVIDGRIMVEGVALVPAETYEVDEEEEEEDLAEVEKRERMGDEVLKEEKRTRIREAEEAKKRAEEAKKRVEDEARAAEERKQAEINSSLWKHIIDQIPGDQLDGSQRQAAVNYIQTKFTRDEADKLIIRLATEGRLVAELKTAGRSVTADHVYGWLVQSFCGLKGPAADLKTREAMKLLSLRG